MELDLEYLQLILRYEPDTGLFIRRVTLGRQLRGSVAGRKIRRGYIKILVEGKSYLAHRLAWFYTYGVWPVNMVDHINRVRDDNRLCNLREATAAENRANSVRAKKIKLEEFGPPAPRFNPLPTFDLSFQKDKQRWRVRRRHQGVRKNFARFKEREDAVAFIEQQRDKILRRHVSDAG